MTQPLHFPPLMYGEPATGGAMEHAVMRAVQSCEAGLVAYRLDADRIEAALVFAPDVALADAVTMQPLAQVGFQNALGALAPPEVAVHLEWDGGIRLNGARCGRFGMRASHRAPQAQPDWLVVGFTLPLWPESDAPGETPQDTALYAEGCADVAAPMLVEAWARHSLNWINRWESDGVSALHEAWRGLAHGIGEPAAHGGVEGSFLGIDERFGMLLRAGTKTHLIALTELVEAV